MHILNLVDVDNQFFKGYAELFSVITKHRVKKLFQ